MYNKYATTNDREEFFSKALDFGNVKRHIHCSKAIYIYIHRWNMTNMNDKAFVHQKAYTFIPKGKYHLTICSNSTISSVEEGEMYHQTFFQKYGVIVTL